jgi:putative membrane protein
MFFHWGWGNFWFGWIFWLAIIGLIIWLIINSSRRSHYNQNQYFPQSPQKETPLDILKKRYAKGEITKEQFDQMKKDLE